MKSSTTIYYCDDCSRNWKLKELRDVRDRSGGVGVPSGECPNCSGICYPLDIKKAPAKGIEVIQDDVTLQALERAMGKAMELRKALQEAMKIMLRKMPKQKGVKHAKR